MVAIDSKNKRDGRVIEFIGRYQPIVKDKQFAVDEEKVLKWLGQGAQPTDTVQQLLKKEGIWQKHLSSK